MKFFNLFTLLIIPVILFSCTKVSQNEIAIRVNKIPLPTQIFPYPDYFMQGVLKGAIVGGQFAYFIPFIQEIHKLDVSPKILSLGESIQIGDKSIKCLRVKTNDGNNLYLRVTVRYRPYNDMAERIILNIREDSTDEFLNPLSVSAVREVISAYTTDQLIDAERFLQSMKKIRAKLNKKIDRFGFEATGVNIETPIFDSDFADRMLEAYDILMEAKKLERNKSSVIAKSITDKRIAELDVAQKLSDANKYYESRTREADAIYGARLIESKGKEIELTNLANGYKMVNQALGASGGENLVAYEMAKTLQGKKILLLPSGKTGMNVNLNELIGSVYNIAAKKADEKNNKAENGTELKEQKTEKVSNEELIKKIEEVVTDEKKIVPPKTATEKAQESPPQNQIDEENKTEEESEKVENQKPNPEPEKIDQNLKKEENIPKTKVQ